MFHGFCGFPFAYLWQVLSIFAEVNLQWKPPIRTWQKVNQVCLKTFELGCQVSLWLVHEIVMIRIVPPSTLPCCCLTSRKNKILPCQLETRNTMGYWYSDNLRYWCSYLNFYPEVFWSEQCFGWSKSTLMWTRTASQRAWVIDVQVRSKISLDWRILFFR